ncbi:hypothetical protein [Luteococcus japonicus]|nr:hypothetical protein [Luteococcus japonicus]
MNSGPPQMNSSTPTVTQTFLHRFTVKPKHLDYLPLWRREVAVRTRHGFTTHRAFVETDAEPKLTWLYSHEGDAAAAEAALARDPEQRDLDGLKAPHVFRNLLVRPVDVGVRTHRRHPGVRRGQRRPAADRHHAALLHRQRLG